MKEYQEKYINHLKKIAELNSINGKAPENAVGFLDERRLAAAAISEMMEENTAMLRKELFPVLDNIASAEEEEVNHLKDFTAHLVFGARQLDPVLNYTIHNALVLYARAQEKRDMLIQELYHTGMALFYMQEIIGRSGKVRYRWKMEMAFGEAASYIKQYDEIENPEIRGFIHRSMANLALSYNSATLEDGQHKLKAIRRSLRILEDPVYHAKTPTLPWDTFIYKSHQERTTAMNLLRAGITDTQVIREVMESAQFVRERQLELCKKKNVKPTVRWLLMYEVAQYHCGIRPLSYLLRWMETVYTERDETDFSENGIYCSIFLPALYAEYLSYDEELKMRKKEIITHMYYKMTGYVKSMSDNQMDESLLKNLLGCLITFIEYPDSLKQKDFLLKLVVCRNPDAYVLFRMTAHIAKMITKKALLEQPEILLGVLHYQTIEDLKAHDKELCQFAYESGMLHDIGILTLNNMVNQIGRSWLEEEQNMYQYHVYTGTNILSRCDSTRLYADTALGHHRFYNEKGGYPAEYERKNNPNQAVTDIVSAASFLVHFMEDKACLNRSGHSENALQNALAKLQKEAGTSFAPAVVNLLLSLETELTDYFAYAKVEAYEEAFQLLKG